jgi:alkylation response protein AidB-like acyl-CoA dehydrogenase
MSLVLTEEQTLLQSTARDFLLSNAPVDEFRKLRNSRDALGYSAELWQQIAELGWAGIIIPEEYGGLEFGFQGLAAIIEETGHTLLASPLIGTAVLGASALVLGGNTQQKSDLLPQLATGAMTLALALEDSNHHNPLGVTTSATPVDGGWQLNGSKVFVMDGHSADQLIVVARSSGAAGASHGLSLFLVDAQTAGIKRTRTTMVDGRNAANIEFKNVAVSTAHLLGSADEGWAILEPVLDRGRIALAAELLGSAWEAFNRTVEYLKEREQFGVKIGSFQALQHRASIMYTELELSKSVVMQAASAVDDDPAGLPAIASLAKARMNDVSKLVTNEAVQMHGGIGVTDELDIGLFLKRSRVAMQLLGDAGYHKDRYATLNGY